MGRESVGSADSKRFDLARRSFRMGLAFVLAFALSGFTPSTLAFAADGADPATGSASEAVDASAAEQTGEGSGASSSERADGEINAQRGASSPSVNESSELEIDSGISSDAESVPGTAPAFDDVADASSSDAANAKLGDVRDVDPAALTKLWVDGSAGNDAYNGGTEDAALKTLAKALELQNSNPTITTIYVKGSFEGLPATTIPGGVNLVVAANTTMTGAGKNGVTLSAGSSLACKNGATLTMSGFATALTIGSGAEVNDGTYVLDGNATGFNLQGKFNGSSRSALMVSAKNSSGSGFACSSASSFNNCTVDVQSTNDKGDVESAINLSNASLTTKGVWYYLNGGLHLEGSDFNVSAAYGHGQAMTIGGKSDISKGSTFAVDGNRVSLAASLDVSASKVSLKNSSMGGLNVNGGSASFTDSIFESSNMRTYPAYGIQGGGGNIVFSGDSVVNTDALNKDTDNGGNDGTGSYVVTGGSFLVAYDPTYNHDTTTPKNGESNGNEWLNLITLADSSTNVVNPINAKGERYAYKVGRASADGKKHVWVPGAKVTFKLNNGNATFADGNAADKEQVTVRGYRLGFARGNSDPGMPVDSKGVAFLGWFYKDASGVEHSFDYATTQFDGDTEVYAKWESKTVIYHNGAGISFADSQAASATDAAVLSCNEVVAKNSSFEVPGKTFVNWNYSPDGSGTSVEPGQVIQFAENETQIDLYAHYTTDKYRVVFSANGGTFGEGSVFKKNPDVFSIEKDSSGGDVAVLKKAAVYGQKFRELLGSVSYNTINPDKADASKPGSLLGDKDSWYASSEGGKTYRFDDHGFWIFTTEGDNPEITSDTTFYLKWEDDPDVKTVKAEGTLDADMWSDSKGATNQIKFVKSGEKFSLTGAIVTTAIKEQMSAIETQFNEQPENFSNIALSDIRSTFTATITLPQEVSVPTDAQVKVDGLGKLFTVDSTKVEGQTVTVTFKLADGIDTYEKLKAAVDSTGLSATRSASEINDSDLITATVSGLSLADGVENGKDFAAIGGVSGTFHSIAKDGDSIKRFDFSWGSQQLEAGKDPKGDKIQQTMVAVVPLESELPADLEVDGDTEHAAVHEAFAGDKVKMTGVVDVSSVKDQMVAIEKQFGTTSDEFESIKLSELESNFKATLTLPDGMEYADDLKKEDIKVEGFADTFTVTDLLFEGQKITVTMTLKDGIENYRQLKDAVDAVDDEMTLTVPKIEIDPEVNPGTKLTVPGTVTGAFFSKATSAAGTMKVFSFKWNGVQTDDGRDAIATDENDPAIQVTLMPVSTTESDLDGDMLVGTDTEHDAVIKQEKGSSFDLTGAVNVASIKEQMDDIEKLYPNTDHKDIRLDIRGFNFKASFTVPDGIELPEGLSVSQVKAEAFGEGFKVSDVKVEGKTVTVSFELADADTILTYDQLEAVVDDAGDNGESDPTWMKLTIPGLKLSSDAEAGKQFTITGDVSGTFRSYANSPSGKVKAFSFKWNGTQWAAGKDAVATDDKPIQLTIEATAPWAPLNAAPKVNAGNLTITAGDPFDIMKGMKVNASDEEDGDLTAKVEIVYPQGFDTSKPGVYVIVFKVTDSNGASSVTTATLRVLQMDAPTPAPGGPGSGGAAGMPKVSDESGPSQADEVNKAETPKTGDVDLALPLGALAVVSLAALGLAFRRRGRA